MYCGIKYVSLMGALLVFMPARASAFMMTFTHTGSGAGTLGGVSFPISNFVITGMGDTTTRRNLGVGWGITHTSASIQIAGLGTFSFLSGTATLVNNNTHFINLGRFPIGGDLFDGPSNAALSTWDMLSPIGPISGQANLLQWTSSPQINTTGGILIFTSGNSATTFTAVPEPATLTVLALGGWVVMRRRPTRQIREWFDPLHPSYPVRFTPPRFLPLER